MLLFSPWFHLGHESCQPYCLPPFSKTERDRKYSDDMLIYLPVLLLSLTVLTQIIFFNIGNTHFVWLKLFLFWGVRLLIVLQMYSITVRLHQFNILIWPTSSYFNKTIEIIFLISRSIFFFVFFPALFKVSNLFYFNINKINIEKNIFFCLNLFIYDKKIILFCNQLLHYFNRIFNKKKWDIKEGNISYKIVNFTLTKNSFHSNHFIGMCWAKCFMSTFW